MHNTAATARAQPALRNKPIAVVMDLAGNRRRAVEWAEEHLPGFRVSLFSKAELKRGSKAEALKRLRSMRPDTFAFFVSDLRLQSSQALMTLFAVACGARRVLFRDEYGETIERSTLGALLIDAPRLVFELLAGYLLLVPLSWLLTLVLWVLVFFKNHGPRPAPKHGAEVASGPLKALYVRATIVGGAPIGGALTHTLGFIIGALGLGHRFKLIMSGQDAIDIHSSADTSISIPPSIISATRALLELQNNLIFTATALVAGRRRLNGVDFIYQRYSRFNWTGVVLSLISGLPLLLEFNGSEVWVSRHWDPVGQIVLLSLFERLNLSAAGLIFVVSDVQFQALVAGGVEPRRIVANPNGVDTNLFRPDCGGVELRRKLGIEGKIVVGFVGTFGPWHGAIVLAQAAGMLADPCRFHLLFAGDGDQRGETESVFASHPERATFAGRIEPSQVPAYMDACDILVSPQTPMPDGSEFFGSPTKLFEYMSMSKPVIASRLGQIADVIVDGESGLLVEPGSARAIADAINRLAADAELRSRLGAAARARVEAGYTWRHNAERVFEAARSLIKEAK